MDPQRFDRLARTLGGAISRRGTLAALLGAGLAGLGGDAAAKSKKRRQRKGKEAGKRRKRKAQRSPATPLAAEAADCLNPGPNSNMNGCPYQGEDFSGEDLSGSTMVATDFRNAELVDTDLSSSNMKNADFRGANLRCADLSSSNLKGARFQNADLTLADLASSGCAGMQTNAGTTFCQTIRCNGDVDNSDCPQGETVCCDDGDCTGGQTCCGGICIDADACCTNGQPGCESGQHCCAGQCRECCTNADCPSGFCHGHGECAPKECAEDSCDFAGGVICGQPAVGGTPCRCQARADGSGLFCAAFLEQAGCVTTNDCPQGQVCVHREGPECLTPVNFCAPQCDWPD